MIQQEHITQLLLHRLRELVHGDENKSNSLNRLIDVMKNENAVNCTFHKSYPQRLVCLHYNQTRANFQNPITLLCRGIIVDLETMQIVHLPFSKFFNFNEKLALEDSKTINEHFAESSVKIYTKFDGSIVNFYYFDGEWRVASSSTPDGSAHLGFFSTSTDKEVNEKQREITQTYEFAGLVWDTFKSSNYELPSKDCEGKYSFTFELLTPKHPLVVQHKSDQLILHGVRDLETFRELDPESFAKRFNWRVATCVKQENGFTCLEDVENKSNELNPFESEGFVACYQRPLNDDVTDFIRVKIKNREYVRLSLVLYDSIDKRENSFIDIIRTNESSEFLAYYPHFQESFEKLQKQYSDLVNYLTMLHDRLKEIIKELSTEDGVLDDKKQRQINSQAISKIKEEKQLSKTIVDILFSLSNQGETIQDVLANLPLKRYKLLL